MRKDPILLFWWSGGGGEILYQLSVAVKQITPAIGSLEPLKFVISQSQVVGNLGTG